MDGFTYEQTVGGWHVCDVCGVRVSHELKHQAWHQALTEAIMTAATGRGTLFLEWNTVPREEARD